MCSCFLMLQIYVQFHSLRFAIQHFVAVVVFSFASCVLDVVWDWPSEVWPMRRLFSIFPCCYYYYCCSSNDFRLIVSREGLELHTDSKTIDLNARFLLYLTVTFRERNIQKKHTYICLSNQQQRRHRINSR